jgi:hypothetical protein
MYQGVNKHKRQVVHVVVTGSKKLVSRTLASSLPLDIQINQIMLTPSLFKKNILHHGVVAKIAPILFIIGGLPDSKKTTAIQQMMAVLTGEIPEYFEELNINNYSSSAVQRFSEIKFKNFCTKIQEYSKVIHAALENDTRTKGEILLSGNEVELNIAILQEWFTDDRLNKRFKEIFKHLYDLTNKLTLQRVRNCVEISRLVSEWDKSFTSGMALIKVWDIGFNKVSMYILPLLAGHLTNSHLWMFLDLMRDVDKLYMPPDLPKNRFDESRNDDKIMLRWRARIHYLLRFAKLASSILEKRKNVCQVVASVTSEVPSDDIADKIEQLRRSVESAAKQMEVGHLIDTKRIIEFKALDAACTEALEEAFKDVVRHQLKNICEVPLSFLFLRSAFYDADLYYIKKSDLREVAIKQLNFTPESFEKFCSVFSSFASIIDLDLITPSSDLIILQPFRFINELDKLFYPTPDDDTSVLITKYGIVTESAAKRIFGADASSIYMKFLESVNLAVKLPSCKFDKSLDDSYAYYLPNARNSPATDLQKKCNPTSLHLFRNLSRPTLHLQVLFAKVLLKDDSFMLDMSLTHEPCNIMTRFKAINEGIVFDFVYLGDAIEFRFPNDDATPEICRKIIVVCKEILPDDIKYNFAIMCQSEDTNDADTLQNSRHLFPLKGSCKKCSISLDTATDAVKMWNSVIEEETVPDEQKLTGAPLTIDQTKSLCVEMVGLSSQGADELARSLGFKGFAEFDAHLNVNNKWRSFMKMLLQWEESPDPSIEMEHPKNELRSKKELAQVMHRLSERENLSRNDRTIFKRMSEDIDLTVKWPRK